MLELVWHNILKILKNFHLENRYQTIKQFLSGAHLSFFPKVPFSFYLSSSDPTLSLLIISLIAYLELTNAHPATMQKNRWLMCSTKWSDQIKRFSGFWISFYGLLIGNQDFSFLFFVIPFFSNRETWYVCQLIFGSWVTVKHNNAVWAPKKDTMF